jgi:hypothetical protein
MTTYVFGDVHGHTEVFADRLREAELIDDGTRWSGGSSTLWLLGDFTDRGPFGVEAIELAMRLQGEARAAGGAVHALLGNHDLLIAAVARFGDFPVSGGTGRVRLDWITNGGRDRDLERLTEEQVSWLCWLPAVARVNSSLLVHCDSVFYRDLGDTVEAVNDAVRDVTVCGRTVEWDELLGASARRFELADPDVARDFAAAFGCERIVHGHTPIPVVTGDEPETVREPLVYADGRCVNVDGGLFLGGPGFVWRLED